MITLEQHIKDFIEGYFNDYVEMGNEYAVYCPFHTNTDTPAFYINRKTGLFHCFNASCGAKGNFHQLLERLGLKNADKVFFGEDYTVEEIIGKLNDLENNRITEPKWQEALDKMTINYKEDTSKLQYLIDRGFHPSVLQNFEVGYSQLQNRIVIPLRNENYKLVGFIGRSPDDEIKPKYKYSDGLPRGSTLFNLQNAKHYNSVYITEGSLDAVKVHQAGFPNVVSTLGSKVSQPQMDLINKYFDEITILSDADEAGKGMECDIIDRAGRKNIWLVDYPEGLKDPGDCTEEQIREAIINKRNYLDVLFENSYKK
jgi:DNA primase